MEALSYAEIADRLGLKLGTVEATYIEVVTNFERRWPAANPGACQATCPSELPGEEPS